jgi:hexokinase
MNSNIFNLDTKKLKEIALSLKNKVETGLCEENAEVQCIPTFITPKTTGIDGKAVVLDLGGTNYRVAKVDFSDKEPVIHPNNGWKIDLSIMKKTGFTQEDLLSHMAEPIGELHHEENMPIGYCFSYPAESMPQGDAKLLRWTKGVNINEMVGKPVGKPLLDYLNGKHQKKFSDIKVINDTVASLFAGLADSNHDAYIGLIVGTGTNMASFVRADKVKKLDWEMLKKENPSITPDSFLPINLESGNFHPPHLTHIDHIVDALSDNRGNQRFEKAVSGMYLGEVLKAVFPSDDFEEKFDAQKLTSIISYPDAYRKKYVETAKYIYQRSAKLVAASLAGLILVLVTHNNAIKKVRLTAEGSLFWSKVKEGDCYKDMVMSELDYLLKHFGYQDVVVSVEPIENANLVGTAIAALS